MRGKNILFGVSNVISSIQYLQQKKKGGFLLSLDFFKAYNRVSVHFVAKVMEKMNFGVKFIEWIKMIHRGAKTRFILTREILVNFSIRQRGTH